jgi:hypothetical protein
MADTRKKVITDKSVPGYWRVILDNPPINAIDDSMYDEIFDLVEEIVAEPSLKVVTFSSANPAFSSRTTALRSPVVVSESHVGSRRPLSLRKAMSSASLS